MNSLDTVKNKEVRIALAIPTLDKLSPSFVGSLLDLIGSRMIFRYAIIEGTLLPWARNATINIFYQNNVDFTHLLFIDADMIGFTPQGLHKLVEQDKDIIAGVCTMRRPPYEVTCEPYDKANFNTHLLNGAVVECQWVGMAFTLIKREVLDALAEETPDGKSWFNLDRESRDGFIKEISNFITTHRNKKVTPELLSEAICMGQMSHIGSSHVGEDIGFCKWARRTGFGVYMHCGIIVGHMGNSIYSLKNTVEYAKEQQKNKSNITTSDLKLVT